MQNTTAVVRHGDNAASLLLGFAHLNDQNDYTIVIAIKSKEPSFLERLVVRVEKAVAVLAPCFPWCRDRLEALCLEQMLLLAA
jgi:hypothetical protein